MAQFSAGDLAMIVKCRCEELIGRTVELVQPVEGFDVHETASKRWINNEPGRAWIVAGEGLLRLDPGGLFHLSEQTLIAERKLMPLRGYFLPAHKKAAEVSQ